MNHARIGPVAAELVTESCASGYPLEACGLLIGMQEGERITITRALRCPNVAPPEERTHRFSIDPRIVINVRRSLRGRSEAIVGFFHSHPDAAAVPSATDLEYIRWWPESLWLIVPVAGGDPGRPRGWWLDAGEHELREVEVRVSEPRQVAAACSE